MDNSIALEVFLYLILIVKILFVISLFMKLKAARNGDNKEEEKYSKCQEKLHNLFTLCMGILLIILFNPIKTKGEVCVDGNTKLFLFVFGILSLSTLIHTYMNE